MAGGGGQLPGLGSVLNASNYRGSADWLIRPRLGRRLVNCDAWRPQPPYSQQCNGCAVHYDTEQRSLLGDGHGAAGCTRATHRSQAPSRGALRVVSPLPPGSRAGARPDPVRPCLSRRLTNCRAAGLRLATAGCGAPREGQTGGRCSGPAEPQR